MDYKENNFDILRIVLASIVVIFHIGVLTGNTYLSLFPGHLAVQCFFVISGFLITKSYLNKKSLKIYALSRFKRIYPLYFIVVITCFIFGYFISNLTLNDYLTNGGEKYLFANLLLLNFIQPSLPNVFDSNLISNAVNGSLWTIKVEVMFYCTVPIIYGLILTEKYQKCITVIIGIISLLSFYLFSYLIESYHLPEAINHQLPTMMIYFMVGAYINFIKTKFHSLVYILPLLIYISIQHEYHILQPFVVMGIVYTAAFILPKIKVNKNLGDISYGIYIWHFPIIQFYIYKGWFGTYYYGLIMTLLTVFVFSFLSWHLIESKLIHRK